jgi:mannosyltransferase
MLATLPIISKKINLAVLGNHYVPNQFRTLSYKQFLALCKTPLPDGNLRVFHARRNDEMIQAIVARRLTMGKLRIVFTSTAQRNHSLFTRYLMSQMDGIISTCQAAASYLRRKPDVIIPHGVDQEVYHPAKDKATAWRALGYPGKYGVGIFGRVRKQKGVDIFVKAAISVAGKHPDFTFLIGGEITPSNKPFVQSLQHHIKEAGLQRQILFIGKQPLERLPELFRGVSILAALSRNEGFGLTPLEGMASGTAVLTSEAGAWKEIVQEGITGFCLPCGDAIGTARKMNAMMVDQTKLAEMGACGRKLVEKEYTITREANQIAEYLGGLIR